MSRLELDHSGEPEVLDDRFVLVWDSLVVRIHGPTLPSQDSNPGPISLARERLTSRPLSWTASNGVN
ncbi:unnamed protein product, partial [Schistosoma haematobium]